MRVLPAFLMSPRCWRWTAAVLLICASGLLQAQDQAPPDDGSGAGDPPSRIARLSYREGDVGLLPAGEKDWGDASLNRPLTTGDRLSTGQNGRAELELDNGTLRIADDSNFGFLTLNDQLTQVELTQGTVNLTVRGTDNGQGYEIDTPTVALVVNQPGTYRVDISEDGKSTRVTDFDGRATVYGEGGAQRMVAEGRSYEFTDSSLNEVTVNDIEGGDDFDTWCNSRNQRYASEPGNQYVSPDVVGAQDLNQYGNWQSDPDYGQVWYPSNVGADWSPYSDGHWSYVAPWGWTWVDTAPWGFAPYHYGRWAHVRERWCWVPGPVGVRPVYAPALVAFVGGVSVSVGIGAHPVGWFPLAPGEVYNPWYHASRGYYTNVNVTNIYVRNVNRTVVINNINNNYNYFRQGRGMPNERYVNRDVPHAFRAMSGQDFVAARNARQHMAPMDPRQFANAPVAPRGVSGMAPVRASYAPPRAANARPLPAGGFQREVVARTPPAANFAGGRPANVAGVPRMAPAAPGNVRLLNEQGPSMRSNGPNRQPANPADQNGPSRFNAQAPANRPSPRPDNDAAMRPGELPSSRFARPNDQQTQYQRGQNNQPRPGVSYIPNAAEDRSRAQQGQGTLPNAPRIEQAPRQPTYQDNAAQRQAMQQQQMQQQQAQQRQEMQQRQAEQHQEIQQRQMQEQQQQQAQQRQEMQQRQQAQQQEMQQRQQAQQQMQQRQAMQQQEMQQRQMQQQQQRGYEPPRGYQPPQAQPRPENNQPHPQQGHEERKPPPPRKDEQHN
ncbi:FecR family protein [Dyella telluris]|uniref:FecR domain-containing protein n=1 Tax=Dyella telluris TaxID=2763498 RepID=A0A7G8PZS1_9GAMM|nr:FecR family protein [Dyella telluris]QNK00029.1 FecR domain-containing protein [Dyella telluris]